MILRILLFALFFGNSSVAVGQETIAKGEITDDRDGKVYQTIKLGHTVWLTENMKFKTEHSVDLSNTENGSQLDGYYYPYEETSKVCPSDFRLPKESDWEKYIQYLFVLKDIPTSSIKYFETVKKKVSGNGILDSSNKLQFFDDPNPLNLEKSGLIQGGSYASDQALSFWSRKDGSNDHKYHLHITANDYSNHTHKHHVIARKKKKRKFVIRCVKEEIIK